MSLSTSQLFDFSLNIDFDWGFCIILRTISQSAVFAISNSVYFVVCGEEGEMIGSSDSVSDISESLNAAGSEKIFIDGSTPSVGSLAPGKKRS